jgi:hypothetical protein
MLDGITVSPRAQFDFPAPEPSDVPPAADADLARASQFFGPISDARDAAGPDDFATDPDLDAEADFGVPDARFGAYLIRAETADWLANTPWGGHDDRADRGGPAGA